MNKREDMDNAKRAELGLHTEFSETDSTATVESATRKADDKSESIELFEPGMCRPSIPHSKEDLEQLCRDRLKELYGDRPHQCVQDRLDWELSHILENDFDFEYMRAYHLAKRAKEQHHHVMTWAGACASFVTYLLGISEINPLPPHYRCLKCMYTEFSDAVSNGNDLPDKPCPHCGEPMHKNGYDIPAEVFLALDGSRVPDIDLVFPSNYFGSEESHLQELFGLDHAVRGELAISFSDRFAVHFKKYCEEDPLEISDEKKERIADLHTDVKCDDGSMSRKYVILPGDKERSDNCLLQRNSRFDSRSMTRFETCRVWDSLYTQDVRGIHALTILEELEKLTNVMAHDIPLNDPLVFQMIADGDFDDEFFELGEWKKRNLLDLCKPETFAELIKISGIAHVGSVWDNNGELLLKNKTARLRELVTHRDDIFLYLLNKGVPCREAYRLMEATRKGAIKSGRVKNHREVLSKYHIPKWYIESLEKIDYLFPKAHSAECVTLAFQLAWYKVHFAEAYAKANEMSL